MRSINPHPVVRDRDVRGRVEIEIRLIFRVGEMLYLIDVRDVDAGVIVQSTDRTELIRL